MDFANAVPCKVFKQRTNRRIGPNGVAMFEPGCNEYKIKRMGPSSENKGPSGRKARPFAKLRREMAARMPLWMKSTKPK